jgi:hypothetical protein
MLWVRGRSFRFTLSFEGSDIKFVQSTGFRAFCVPVFFTGKPLRNPAYDLFGAPMLSLREVVDRYFAVAGKFGQPASLSAFQLSPAEVQTLFNVLDEDYHLSRFLQFSNIAGESYVISGASVTHLSIDPGIQTML